MAENLAEILFRSKKGADVTFIVEGEKILAHRAILSIVCPYFDTMLFGSTMEANMEKIELKETPAKQFKQIVRYCYLHSLDVNDWDEHDVLNLLSLAHEYQFDDLIHSIERELLRKHIRLDTIDVIFTYATRLGRASLVQNCLTFAEENFEEMLQHNHFLRYSAQLLSSMLEIERFRHQNQDRILVKIGKWKANHSRDELKGILKKVNWKRASRNTITKLVEEFVEKTDFTELNFWDTISVASVQGLAVTKESNSTVTSLGDSSVTSHSNACGSEESRTGQLSSFPSCMDVTCEREHLTSLLNGLHFVSYFVLQKGVERKVKSEKGDVVVCLTKSDVRMKFQKEVFVEEVSFQVSVEVSKGIKSVECNGSHHKIVGKAERNDYVSFQFCPYMNIKIGRWFQVLLSQKLSNIALRNFTVRGHYI